MKRGRDPYQRYAGRLLLALGAYLLVAAAINAVVDPWRVLRTPLALKSLENYRDFSDAHRTGKAGLAMDPAGWDMIYTGSSRLEMGLPTTHPAFGGQRVVNLALAGGMIPENTAMARFAMRKNPGLKTMVLGVDTGDLTSTMDLSGQTDFSRSPLADGQSPTERVLRYLTGVRALGESLKLLANLAKGKESKYTLGGQRVGGLGVPPDIRAYVAERPETYRARAHAFDTAADVRINERKVKLLRGLLEDARRAGIRVIVLLPPRHALLQIHPVEDAPAVAPWLIERTLLAEICTSANQSVREGPPIELWDFCTFNPVTGYPLPAPGTPDQGFHQWPDLEHFSSETGLKLLERIVRPEAPAEPDWGVEVLRLGITEHLARLRAGHARYCREHPADAAWFRTLVLAPE